MDVEVVVERAGQALVLSPIGRLDSANVHSFEAVVMDHLSKGERRVIVDFSRLDFISSSGMRVLLIARKALMAKDGKLVLCSMKDHIEEIFKISGFIQIIPIKSSRDAALAAASA